MEFQAKYDPSTAFEHETSVHEDSPPSRKVALEWTSATSLEDERTYGHLPIADGVSKAKRDRSTAFEDETSDHEDSRLSKKVALNANEATSATLLEDEGTYEHLDTHVDRLRDPFGAIAGVPTATRDCFTEDTPPSKKVALETIEAEVSSPSVLLENEKEFAYLSSEQSLHRVEYKVCACWKNLREFLSAHGYLLEGLYEAVLGDDHRGIEVLAKTGVAWSRPHVQKTQDGSYFDGFTRRASHIFQFQQ